MSQSTIEAALRAGGEKVRAAFVPYDFEVLRHAMLRRLRPIGFGLLTYYSLISIAHLLVLPRSDAYLMAGLAAASALFGAVLAAPWTQTRLHPGIAHEVGLLAILVVATNGLMLLFLQGAPIQTTNLILTQIAIGAVLLSWQMGLAAHIVILGGWATAAIHYHGAQWSHFGFALLAGFLLSMIVQRIQVTILAGLEKSRLEAAEQQVLAQASEARWRIMLESSLEGIAVIRGTEIEESNRAFRLLVEQASPGDEAKELHALIAPASWPALEELLASASSKPIALQLRSNDGQPRFVEMASGRVGAGKNSVTVVTMRDITALRQWEAGIEESKRATEEAAVAKGQFLANMSHELRTPLNGIIGMSDLLRRTELTAEQDDYLNTIMASGQHLQTIISNLLDYNRLEAQKIVLESRTFSVWDFVENTMNMIYPLAAKRGIELMHSIDSAVPEAVNGDEFRLRQVLFNLMGNAVKFTEQGHVALQVSWENHRLRFSVVDTGIGIPKDRIASLFSPFVQADHSTTRRFGGTGLGLVISHELVNLMGGTIEVTSEPGFGSTFEFSLPLPIVEAPAKPAPSKAGGILLLTSNDVIASHLQSILLPAGYSVVRQDESVPESIAAIVVDWPLTETIAPTELDLVQALQENPRARLVVLANSTVDESTFPRHEILARCRKPIRRRELLAAIDGSLLPVENGKSLDNGGGLPPAISKLRILVADDDPTNRKVLHEYLQRLGASATFAVDGDEALRKALTSSFDLLLIDYQMPGKDGLEVMRQLRGTPNPCQASFLVLLTADARPERAKAALAAGANRHVAKPVSLATIQGLLMEQITNQSGSSSQATNSPEVGPGKVMDFSVADELHKALGDTAFRQLLSTFLTELKSLHKKMVSSVKAKNADEARRVFHTIGSSAATFGAIELQRLARKAEHACEGGSTAAAAEFVAPIEIGISEVQSHFAAVLSGKK